MKKTGEMILPEELCESLLFQRYILISRVFLELTSNDCD